MPAEAVRARELRRWFGLPVGDFVLASVLRFEAPQAQGKVKPLPYGPGLRRFGDPRLRPLVFAGVMHRAEQDIPYGEHDREILVEVLDLL